MDNVAQIYIRTDKFGDMTRVYRVQVFASERPNRVWVERQTPRAFAGNLPIVEYDPDELFNGSSWNLDMLNGIVDVYEKQYISND